MTAPTSIKTQRLLLRQFEHNDWPAMHEHYSDAGCTKFTFRRALTEGESWRAMASMVDHWQLRGHGPYAVVETESQQVVGAAGLWYPNDWPEAEIKWALTRKYWGKGDASEAVRAIQGFAASVLGGLAPMLASVRSHATPRNRLTSMSNNESPHAHFHPQFLV